jgi:hypothetical protein
LNQKVGWRVGEVVVGDDGVVVTIEQVLVEWWWWRWLLPSVGGVVVEMGGPIEQERGRVFIGVGDTGVGCLEARPGSKRERKGG